MLKLGYLASQNAFASIPFKWHKLGPSQKQWTFFSLPPKELLPVTRVVLLHHFNADPDPAFHFSADKDPAFHFNASLQTQIWIMLLLLMQIYDHWFIYINSRAPYWVFIMSIHGPPSSILSLLCFDFNVDPDPDPDPAFHSKADPGSSSRNDAYSCGYGSANMLITWYLNPFKSFTWVTDQSKLRTAISLPHPLLQILGLLIKFLSSTWKTI